MRVVLNTTCVNFFKPTKNADKTQIIFHIHSIQLFPSKSNKSYLVKTAIHYLYNSQVRSYSFADQYLINKERINAIDIYFPMVYSNPRLTRLQDSAQAK